MAIVPICYAFSFSVCQASRSKFAPRLSEVRNCKLELSSVKLSCQSNCLPLWHLDPSADPLGGSWAPLTPLATCPTVPLTGWIMLNAEWMLLWLRWLRRCSATYATEAGVGVFGVWRSTWQRLWSVLALRWPPVPLPIPFLTISIFLCLQPAKMKYECKQTVQQQQNTRVNWRERSKLVYSEIKWNCKLSWSNQAILYH